MNRTVKNAHKEAFHIDGYLLLISVLLILLGYVMVASASLHWSVSKEDGSLFDPLMTNPLKHDIVKQTLHIGLGIALSLCIAKTPLRVWEKRSGWLFVGGLLLLVIVLIPGLGAKVNGSIRWLQIFGIRIQVSEIVKFFSVIYMAGYVTRYQQSIRNSAFSLIKPLLLFGLACALLLLEPDFGSSVVIIIIAMGLMYLAGARLWQFIMLFTILMILAFFMILFSPYRLLRVASFTNPWDDVKGSDYQLSHALISFGRGEWTGVGLGSGVQKLFYLPEAHTDFLFSVIGEELGFIGVITVIGLFTVLVLRCFKIAKAAEQAGQSFSAYIAYGLGIWFGFQAIVNMGVNLGVLPTKGLTLPLMSYGGGSMMVMCCAIALLLRVYSETTELKASSPKQRTGIWAKV